MRDEHGFPRAREAADCCDATLTGERERDVERILLFLRQVGQLDASDVTLRTVVGDALDFRLALENIVNELVEAVVVGS
ncbi:MAG TPA: hypothetical protein VFD92_04930 [Candidatus Binatia bacterium]|nr:hypothetical protein [Candidatus Binatia bacterium]